jgi:hypothetical protein
MHCRVSLFLIAKEESATGAITAKTIICEGVDCPVGVRRFQACHAQHQSAGSPVLAEFTCLISAQA